ncbi:ArsR family transcriptional regulator [Xylanimonas allomyrinae]|uniref:ArsR family transcriptional regulator n=1 Tax=Xylanimonas allomyrinae TaxID=2509459 RepID=A0A4P6EU51_9MICO|nr:ArsR family transcriptional regulator [Xylanimonas allomyrinae]
MEAAACLFRGFSEPTRMSIVRHLALGEHRVVDLTRHLGLAQSTVSQHLACLRDCGLVESRAVGRASVFSLAHRDSTLALFAAAERLLALTGDAVALCPSYGSASHRTADNAAHAEADAPGDAHRSPEHETAGRESGGSRDTAPGAVRRAVHTKAAP